MITLKDFQKVTVAARVEYRCNFADCDFETASNEDTRTLQAWENSNAIVTEITEYDGVLLVECEITVED